MAIYTQARDNMVLSQLLPNKIFSGAILKIMAKLPREEFVPRSLSHLCYGDEAIKVLKNRYLLSPMVFGRLAQEANIQKTEKILDIGFGTGYSSILLSFLCRKVISLENDKSLVTRLKNTLLEYEVLNVYPVSGSLRKGWSEEAPYDVIFIEGAVQHIPDVIMNQVKEGGRIITMQEQGFSAFPHALVLTKKEGSWTRKYPFEAATPRLDEFTVNERFIL
ncbi:protein-L-isoaspartate O-methyltransferase [Caedimonas varicaedens]|uniref:Protein-L-isoaspartate O-methyltransferase n=1 Tax=Caedimonas varicaedens TaxID=1629334 RepID=A0A0K8ME85_9PROT|nr:protein-L-isoaspartate O-methyltransferase [Caedimonas varicaedens]